MIAPDNIAAKVLSYRDLPKDAASQYNIITDEDPDKKKLYSVYEKLSNRLKETNFIALSAPQIGINKQIFVLKGVENYECFINPLIVDMSEEAEAMDEMSLSYSGVPIKIKRPKTIKVRYQDLSGEIQTKSFIGMTARYFLVMMDYLNAVPLRIRTNLYQYEQLVKKMNKIQKV